MKKISRASFVAIILLLVFLTVSCSSTKKSTEKVLVQDTKEIVDIESVNPPAEEIIIPVPAEVPEPTPVVVDKTEEPKEEVEVPPYEIVSFVKDNLVVRINNHRVTLDIAGGKFEEDALDVYTAIAESNPSSVPLPILQKDGYVRNIWKDSEGNVITDLVISTLSSDITLKAEWIEKEEVVDEPEPVEEIKEKPITYSLVSASDNSIQVKINGYLVTLILSDGNLASDALETYIAIAASNPITVPLPTLTKSGYEDYTWKDEEGNIVTELDLTALTSNVIFKAERGEIIKYPVTYDEDGVLYQPKPEEEIPVVETVPEEPIPVVEEEKKPEFISFYTVEDAFTLNDIDRYGYEFMGWILNGQESYEAEKPAEITLGTTGPKDFVAVWEPFTSTITYELNGGEFLEDQRTSFLHDEEPFTIANPIREHYIFLGWSVNGNEEEVQKDYVVDSSLVQDIHLEAIWIPKDFTIVYDEEGILYQEKPEEIVIEEKEEEIILKNPVTYTVEDEFDLINPTKYGYDFCGWIENGEPSYKARTIYSVLKGTSGDKEFVTVWSPVKVSISYKLNGGKAENRTSYTFAEKSFTLNQPTREHYVFKGWRSAENEKPILNYVVDTKKAEDLTLEAVWAPVEYPITYNLNGGVFPEYPENPTTLTVEDDTFTIINPIKEGYTFKGWNIEIVEPSYGPIYTLDLSNDDSTFRFEVYPEYTLFNFSENTMIGDKLALLIKSINEEYPKLTSTWTYKNVKDGIIVKYPEGNAEYVKAYLEEELQACFPTVTIKKGSYGERVLTALWKATVYSITYDKNGVVYTVTPEAEPTNPTSYTIEDHFILINPERTGYTFLGWIKEGEPETMARSIYEIKVGSTGDLNLIPVWKKNVYTITYIMNGGEIPENAPTSFSYGDPSIRLDIPTKENYSFEGWKDSEDASPLWIYTIKSDLNRDLTLEAVWTPEKYYISYDLNGGKMEEETSNPGFYTIETEDFYLQNPVRDYYVFKGWKELGQYDSKAVADYKVITKEARYLYLVAVWEPVEYSISYVNDGKYKYEIVNPTSYTVESEDLYIAKPYKDGYDFLGWVVAGDRTETLNNPMVIKSGSHGDLKLYAEFRVSSIPVGTVTELQYRNVVYGKNGIIRPDWVIKVPESAAAHYEKGYAKGSDFYETYLEAIKAAKASYASWLMTNVELTDKNINNVIYDSKAFSESASLVNIEVVEYWEDAEGGIWVLIK